MFGDDYEELANCGVDFDPTCNNATGYIPTDADLEELLGECEEEDEECISRYLLQRKKASGSFSSQSKKISKDKDGDRRLSSLTKIATLSPTLQTPAPEPHFEGLPKDYYKKKYKPDYPTDLQMKQVCSPKVSRRGTLGITRTQPKAVFIPSLTTLARQEQKGAPAADLKSGLPGEHAIFTEDRSPLEQSRLPPQVVSSSDEIVVEWLENHNVQMMFEYFLGLCVIHQPADPWVYISDLCANMIEARNDLTMFDNLPRILTPEHIEAIFRIYDRIENEFITVPQYKSAMDAMGLNSYSTNPGGWEDNAISKDTFVKEATEAFDNLLRTFMVFEQDPMQDQNNSNVNLRNSKSVANVKRSSYSGSETSSSGEYSGSRSGSNDSIKPDDSPPGSTEPNQPPGLELQIQF